MKQPRHHHQWRRRADRVHEAAPRPMVCKGALARWSALSGEMDESFIEG